LHVQLAMPFLAIENLYVLDMYNLLWVDGQAHQPYRALPCRDLFRYRVPSVSHQGKEEELGQQHQQQQQGKSLPGVW
jgi:hypothetical protein